MNLSAVEADRRSNIQPFVVRLLTTIGILVDMYTYLYVFTDIDLSLPRPNPDQIQDICRSL